MELEELNKVFLKTNELINEFITDVDFDVIKSKYSE